MMDSRDVRATLDDVAARRQHTLDVGSTASHWPRLVLTAVLVVAFGAMIDLDMIWVGGILLAAVVGLWGTKLVALRRTRSWGLAFALSFVIAIGADIGVQFLVRARDLPSPNTWGAAAAAAVLLLVSRPLQVRGVRDRRTS